MTQTLTAVATADAAPIGTLRLRVARRGDRSVAVEQYHQGALRVMRPHYLDPWQVTYAVINPGGGYLGGDRYRLDVAVEGGSGLLLTSQAATKVYRTPDAPARQDATFRVAEGGLLEYLPDQLIMYRDGSYIQDTTVVLEPGATCILADIVTPGWSPEGEPFRYQWARLRNRVVRPGGELVLLDNLVLDPGAGPLTGLGVLDGHTHAASLLVIDPRVDAELVDRVHDMSTTWDGIRVGTTIAPGPTLVVRLLGSRTEQLQKAISQIDDLVRGSWFGLAPVNLRKY